MVNKLLLFTIVYLWSTRVSIRACSITYIYFILTVYYVYCFKIRDRTDTRVRSSLYSIDFSMRTFMIRRWSFLPNPTVKPSCSRYKSSLFIIHLVIILVNSLQMCDSRLIGGSFFKPVVFLLFMED